MTIRTVHIAGARLLKGHTYFVRPRYIDFLLGKVASTLNYLDVNPENVFLQLLNNPNQIAANIPIVPLSPQQLQPFSPSQQVAFDHSQKHRVQVLWGPPGTGKTNHLALTLTRLVESATVHELQNFLIVITAFTKDAIRELLSKLRSHYEGWNRPQMHEFAQLCTFVVSIYEDKKQHEGGGYCCQSDPKKYRGGGIQILCGTVHQLAKYHMVRGTANIVVIDEGSQMLLADASIPISLLHPQYGRLILAGDHLQLPPILKAEYPPSEPGKTHLATSVLQAFLSASAGNIPVDFLTVTQQQCPILVQLTENWRSNTEIGNFTRRLYHTGYNHMPGHKFEHLQPVCKPDTLLADILSSHASPNAPPHALVVIEVKTECGILQAEVERKLEAVLVHKLVLELHEACPTSPCYVPTLHRSQRFFIGKQLAELIDKKIDYKGMTKINKCKFFNMLNKKI